MLGDIIFVIKWWLYILLIGILFLPFTQKVFRPFYDKGYIFSKAIGVLVLSYCSWLLPSSLSAIPLLVFAPAALFALRGPDTLKAIKENKYTMLFEELLFTVMLFFWCYVRGMQPDIYGLEKYMDFGFVNAILRADAMPPTDIWFAGKSINYYYFGHYICAYLTRLTGIKPAVSYNLMMAALFALSFTLTFSIASNLLHLLKGGSMRKLIAAGLIAASLLAFGGNLHGFLYGYGLMKGDSEYYYPDSTRYIGYDPPTDDKTIHEFPSYSFIVSDLHGHVSDIPAVLTFLAVCICCSVPEGENRGPGFRRLLLLGLLLSNMYMTNTWDYPIYITVLSIIMLYRYIRSYTAYGVKALAAVLSAAALSQLFALPFSLKFESIAAGVDFVRYRTPLYQLMVLWGYQLFYVLCFFVFLIIAAVNVTDTRPGWFGKLVRNAAVPDMLCFILCCCGMGLLLIPETVYVRDIYSRGYHRANTMFKLTYQAFIMFCIAAGYISVRIPSAIRHKRGKTLIAAVMLIVYLMPMSYFPLAVKGYYGALAPSAYKGLDGLQFIKSKYPEDYGVIEWFDKNVEGQPTILEAHGDSYSSYCRISAATGLPTVQGWYVHEWLWRNDRHEPENRGKEVRKVYESRDMELTLDILDKYAVRYIVIGDLEREKFRNLNEAKLLSLGETVYEAGNTKIIKVKPFRQSPQ